MFLHLSAFNSLCGSLTAHKSKCAASLLIEGNMPCMVAGLKRIIKKLLGCFCELPNCSSSAEVAPEGMFFCTGSKGGGDAGVFVGAVSVAGAQEAGLSGAPQAGGPLHHHVHQRHHGGPQGDWRLPHVMQSSCSVMSSVPCAITETLPDAVFLLLSTCRLGVSHSSPLPHAASLQSNVGTFVVASNSK